MNTRKILTSQAKPGMIAADDIYTFNNQLIIAKDTTLTDRIITRLKFYSIPNFLIFEEDNKTEENISVTSENYYEKIKNSDEFKVFHESFDKSVATLKYVLRFVNQDNSKIDTSDILAKTAPILGTNRNGIEVFDMLHCMRDYDDLTYAHSLSVALICKVMGYWFNFSREDIEVLTLCGLLHDCGKLKIPQEIITKPSKLTSQEYEVIKTHTLRGYEILKDQDIDTRIKYAALMHHERCDGSGYPNAFTSKQIDKFAKIVSIADVYDAMTSKRVYRGPLCPFEAIEMFEKEGFQKFDPEFILPFLNCISQTYINNTVQLNNGKIGEIVLINPRCYARPMIKIGDRFIDLTKYPYLTIESVL